MSRRDDDRGLRGTHKQESVPLLTDDIVANEQSLAIAINTFIGRDRLLARQDAQVLRRQRQFRDAVDDDEVWQDFLALDNAWTDRLSDLTGLLVVWAFYQGVTIGQRRGAAQ